MKNDFLKNFMVVSAWKSDKSLEKNLNSHFILRIMLRDTFEGVSIWELKGKYKGKEEKSYLVKFITQKIDDNEVKKMLNIAKFWKQESILLFCDKGGYLVYVDEGREAEKIGDKVKVYKGDKLDEYEFGSYMSDFDITFVVE